MNNLDFEYYTPLEIEKISFVQIPKILFSNPIFKKLSTDAKVLYSFMQDRFRLSKKNNWIDNKNRVYIYFTHEEIREVFDIGRDKVIKLMKELEEYNLIERRKQGFGLPTMIYVKNCYSHKKIGENPWYTHRSEKPTSGSRKNRPLDIGKTDPNKNDISNNDINNIYNQSINQNKLEINKKEKIDKKDYVTIIQENLELELLDEKKFKRVYPIYTIMCDVLKMDFKEKILINNTLIPVSVIQKRFLNEINLNHIEYVLDCVNKQEDIRNMRKYIITSLYNSVGTIDIYYENKVYTELYR